MKGINNQTCIGPCLPKDTVMLHPLYLYVITDYDHNPFCPTFQWGNNIHDVCKESEVVDISSLTAKVGELSTVISSLVTKDELLTKETQVGSDLKYKLHETITYIEERYLVGLKTDISLLDGRVTELDYEINNTRDLLDASNSRFGLGD